MSDKNVKIEYQFEGQDNGLSQTVDNITNKLEKLEKSAEKTSKALEKLDKKTKSQNVSNSNSLSTNNSTKGINNETKAIKENTKALDANNKKQKVSISSQKELNKLKNNQNSSQKSINNTQREAKLTATQTRNISALSKELDKKTKKVKDADDAFKKYSKTIDIAGEKLKLLQNKSNPTQKDLFSFESKLNTASGIEKKIRDLNTLENEIKELQSITKKEIKLFESAGMTDEANILKAQLKELDSALKSAGDSSEIASSKYISFGNKLTKVSKEVNSLSQSLVNAGGKMKTFGENLGSIGRNISSVGRNIQSIGHSMRGLTYGVTAGIAGAVKEGVDVEKSLAGVASTINRMEINLDTNEIVRMDDSTFKEYLNQIETEMKRLSAISPFDNKDVAESFRYTALAGWTPSEMLDSMEIFTKLSTVIGSSDIATDVDKITDSLASLGLAFDKVELDDGSFEYIKKDSANLAKEVQHLTDVMAKAQSISNMDINQLADSYKIVGGTMSTFNVPLEQTTALLAVLANRGLKGSTASRGLSTMMLRLTAKTGESAKALDDLTEKTGINVTAFNKATGEYVGVETQLENIGKAFDLLNDKDRIQFAGLIAGKNHMKTFTKLMEGFRGEYFETKALLENSSGALDEMFDITNQSAWAQLKTAISNVKNALYDAFVSMRPIFTEVLNGITKIAQAFTKLSDGDKKSALLFAGLVAISPLVVTGIGLIVSVIGTLITAFSGLITMGATVITMLGTIGKAGSKAFSGIGDVLKAGGSMFINSKLFGKLGGTSIGKKLIGSGLFKGMTSKLGAGAVAGVGAKKVLGEAVEAGIKKSAPKLIAKAGVKAGAKFGAKAGIAGLPIPGARVLSALLLLPDLIQLSKYAFSNKKDKEYEPGIIGKIGQSLFSGLGKSVKNLLGSTIDKFFGGGTASKLAGILSKILNGVKGIFKGVKEDTKTEAEKKETVKSKADEYVKAEQSIKEKEAKKNRLEGNIDIDNSKIRKLNQQILPLEEKLKNLKLNPEINTEEIQKAEKELDKLYKDRDAYTNLIINAEEEIAKLDEEIGKDRETKVTIKQEIEENGGSQADIDYANKKQILAKVGLELAYDDINTDIEHANALLRKIPGVKEALKAKLEVENISDEDFNEIAMALTELDNFEATAKAYIEVVKGQDEVYQLQKDIAELDESTANAQVVIDVITQYGTKGKEDLNEIEQQAVNNAKNTINSNNRIKNNKEQKQQQIIKEQITPYNSQMNAIVDLGNKNKNKGNKDYITYFSENTQKTIDKQFGKEDSKLQGNMLGKTTTRKMIVEVEEEVVSSNKMDKNIDLTNPKKIKTELEPPDTSKIDEWVSEKESNPEPITFNSEVEVPDLSGAEIESCRIADYIDKTNTSIDNVNGKLETTSSNIENANSQLETTSSNIDSATDSATELSSKINEGIDTSSIEEFGQKTKEAVDSVGGNFQLMVGDIEAVSGAIGNIQFGSLMEAVGGLYVILDECRDKMISISNVAGNLGSESMSAMGQALSESISKARETIMSVANVANNFGKSAMSNMGQALTNSLSDARSAVLSVANVANNYGKNAMAGMGNALVSTVSQAKGIVASIGAQISSMGSQINSLKLQANSIKLPDASKASRMIAEPVVSTPIQVGYSAGFRSIGGNTTNSIANTTSNFNFNVKGVLGDDRQSIKRTARDLTTYCKRRGL